MEDNTSKNEYLKMKEEAKKIIQERKKEQSGLLRVYIDGGFDLLHSGHYNALRQAKAMTDILVVGVNSDTDLRKTKGPTILNVEERSAILNHCKFIDEIISDTIYTPTVDYLKEVNCKFYAHGDDPCIDHTGFNITEHFQENGMLKEFKRTEGVSTTDMTGKLLALAEYRIKLAEGNPENISSPVFHKFENPPKQQFLATSRRMVNFANPRAPRKGEEIIYIAGSWDLLHHGHLKRIEEAKKLGGFLFVGIWDDEMTRYYKGELYPIVSIQERVLMCLGTKNVDDVVIGAPYILTRDLIDSLHITKVAYCGNTEEDPVMEQHKGIDPYRIAKEMGIYKEITIDDPFYDITTEQIAQRVYDNKDEFQKKFDKKNKSEQAYYDSKKKLQEH